ncbi:MAG: helix-turn-helix domain-containing protein [Bacteroidetes bacterium]|nr:helix-turn-helix domain-containing protein [Bacteroidota bacterium]
MPKNTLSRELLEYRRMRAVELFERGWRQVDIATALGVSAPAVSQWIAKARTNGKSALKSRVAPGALPRLEERHRKLIGALLLEPPSAFGMKGEAWTRPLMQRMIKRLFGVHYSVQHVGRLMQHFLKKKPSIPKATLMELKELLGKGDLASVRRRFKTHRQPSSET